MEQHGLPGKIQVTKEVVGHIALHVLSFVPRSIPAVFVHCYHCLMKMVEVEVWVVNVVENEEEEEDCKTKMEMAITHSSMVLL